MRRRILILCLALLCSVSLADAQGWRTAKPRWVGNVPRTEYSTFYFVEVSSDMAVGDGSVVGSPVVHH